MEMNLTEFREWMENEVSKTKWWDHQHTLTNHTLKHNPQNTESDGKKKFRAKNMLNCKVQRKQKTARNDDTLTGIVDESKCNFLI